MVGNERVWASIDLDHFEENLEAIHNNISENSSVIGVVKADGYGHGALPLSKIMEKKDWVKGFAVATPEEAFALREGGIKKPVLLLGYSFPYAYRKIVLKDIRPAVFRMDMAEELSKTAVKLGEKVKIHLAVDTGMSRIGIGPDDAGLAFVKKVLMLPSVEIEGIFTHFARADEKDRTATEKQIEKFQSFCDRVEQELDYKIPIKHCSNSAGIIEYPKVNMDAVRAGIILYGLWPSDEVSKTPVPLKPLLSLYSHIVYVKELEAGREISYGGTFTTKKTMRVATIPVGYADGYPRGLSGKGSVLVCGKRAPILGRICMDQFMIDITDIPDAEEGSLVTLIGKDADDIITMEELGAISGRFNYELACCLTGRVPRLYIGKSEKES